MSRRARCLALQGVFGLFLAGAGAGQDIPEALRRALDRSDRTTVVHELALTLRVPEGRAVFLASLDASRDAGFSELVIAALDRALAARPGDPWLLYERGVVRRDLKFLRAARADFDLAQSRDPAATSLTLERAFSAALAFDAAAAASLYTAAGAPAEAKPYERVRSELAAAEARQWVGLVAVALVVLAGVFALRRRRRVGA